MDHDAIDSTDTESLLSVEQSQEKLLHSLPSPSRRNKRLKTYLHIAAIIFYSIITIILYTWSIRINGKKCDSDNAAIYCKKTGSDPRVRM
jgi:hypothetical protein